MSGSAKSRLGKPQGISGPVRFVITGHWRSVLCVAATAFLGGLLEALFLVVATRTAFAVATGQASVALGSFRAVSIGPMLSVAVGLIALRIALAGYASWQSANVSTGVVAQIRERLSSAFLESSWEVQQAQRAGSLQELLSNYSTQATFLMNSLTQAIVAIGNLLALLGTAFFVDAVGALALVVSVTVLALFLRPVRSLVRRRARASAAAGMEFAVSVNEISELGLELHVFHVHNEAQNRMRDAIEQARQAGARVQFATALTAPVYIGLAYLAIVGALATVAATDNANLTSLGATMLVMLRSLAYGQAAQSSFINVTGTVPVIEALQERLRTLESGRRDDRDEPVGKVGAISMEAVSFSYTEGQEVLRDISFTIAPREIVGIVGPSGGGKSTLVQLLLGLREPDMGRVLADGRDIASFDRAEWARRVTFVPQSAHLIAGTIAENIRFLRDGVSQEDIERAARLAHLHDDIEGFPEGYQREVGKHGGHLSGGQQQRLCIARALVEHPDLLILDEPTSALDVRSEYVVRNTLQSLKDHMTVVVIAHRLSTLTICDRIMVIKDGRLKEFDTPTALERSSDFYREALAISGMP